MEEGTGSQDSSLLVLALPPAFVTLSKSRRSTLQTWLSKVRPLIFIVRHLNLRGLVTGGYFIVCPPRGFLHLPLTYLVSAIVRNKLLD